jgi:anti-anti-sigma factor
MQACRQSASEIDMATAPAFFRAMCDAIDSTTDRAVVINCSAITFMDSSAYHVLMEANRYAIQRDHQLVIGNLTASCAWTMRLCDDREVLTFAP